MIALRNLAVAAMLAASVAPAAADDSVHDLLHSSFALWGMMDAVANFCWEVADWDVAYMETHQNWLARNLWVRDELDASVAANGLPASLASGGESYGAAGIIEILRAAPDKRSACLSWKEHADAGGYDAETFISDQLAVLRERDGM